MFLEVGASRRLLGKDGVMFNLRFGGLRAFRQGIRALAEQLGWFYADESGAHIVEWTVLTVLIILATYTAMVRLRERLTEVFRSLILRQCAP